MIEATVIKKRAPNQINVLSIDGGGIRGIIPATILAEIEARTGKRISQLFENIYGRNIGSGICKTQKPRQ